MEMTIKQLIAAASMFVAAGSALAQGQGQQEFVAPDAGFVSTKSRAEVRAELNQAPSQSQRAAWEYSYPANVPLAAAPRADEQVSAIAQSAPRAARAGDLYFGA